MTLLIIITRERIHVLNYKHILTRFPSFHPPTLPQLCTLRRYKAQPTTRSKKMKGLESNNKSLLFMSTEKRVRGRGWENNSQEPRGGVQVNFVTSAISIEFLYGAGGSLLIEGGLSNVINDYDVVGSLKYILALHLHI